ncbi:membrane protein [Caballeronia novacaledonica]|uniref:Membrane protein n=1 Tax=Caballeronia novacaledonica TaxID=1544861 RepID=A0A2U3IDM7_9BURK|nr:MFS transporter [Caballeronia novacaledonica]SPB18240.1 membrane protein [Caballeronia novacaledonica]
MSALPLQANGAAINMAKKAAFSTVVGNALEWFDFASYAFFATIISRQFFPPGDAATALIGTFAVFGIGLVARPLGAVLFGRLGDVKGRKLALLIAMPMMGFGTLMIGLLPTYASIGIAAPILLVVCRLLQGFSAGGEVGNAIAFLIEWSPPRKRALYSSLQQASAVGGTLIGSLIAASLSSMMNHDLLQSWGWRIPFLIGGLVIAPLGFYLRSKVEETPFFADEGPNSKVSTSAEHPAWVLCAKTVGISTVWVVSFYVFLIYVPAYLSVHGHIHNANALWINTAGLLVMVISIVLSAIVSDVVGRKPLLLFSSICVLVFSYPLFVLFANSTSVFTVFLGIVLCGGLAGIFAGTCPAAMAEMFPTRLRTTGVSIGFGLSTAIFGGFASLISETLIKVTGSQLSPSFFVMCTAIISLAVIFSLKETAHDPLK